MYPDPGNFIILDHLSNSKTNSSWLSCDKIAFISRGHYIKGRSSETYKGYSRYFQYYYLIDI